MSAGGLCNVPAHRENMQKGARGKVTGASTGLQITASSEGAQRLGQATDGRKRDRCNDDLGQNKGVSDSLMKIDS